MKLQHPLLLKILPKLAYGVFMLLRATWRLKEDPLPREIQHRIESGLPVVFAHLHEDDWPMLGFYAKRRMTVLVSLSQDGSLLTEFLKRLGFKVARGSSSRRAAAGLLQLVREVKKNNDSYVSLAVDGPKGPRRKVKGGVFYLAKLLKAPVVCGAAYADRAWIFRRAWSRAFFPKPFSSVHLVYGQPIFPDEIEKLLESNEIEVLSTQLEQRLIIAKQHAKEKIENI